MSAIDLEADWSDDWTLRRARARAVRKARLCEDLIRFALVCGLLLIVVRPIGVIVGLVWGYRLFRRYAGLELFPWLRRYWLHEELARMADRPEQAGERWAPRTHSPHRSGAPLAPRALISKVGDDPASQRNRARAREALADLERLERDAESPRGGRRSAVAPLRLLDVVDAALAGVRPRAERLGVELRREADTAGNLDGDADALLGVFLDVLEVLLDAFARTRPPDPRLEVALGENLAGTRVWVRLRHNAGTLDRAALPPLARALCEATPGEEPGELCLGFSKREGVASSSEPPGPDAPCDAPNPEETP